MVLHLGLQRALAFFLVAAGAQNVVDPASRSIGQNFLCHTSQKTAEHARVATLIRSYLNRLSDDLEAGTGYRDDDASALGLRRIAADHAGASPFDDDSGTYPEATAEARSSSRELGEQSCRFWTPTQFHRRRQHSWPWFDDRQPAGHVLPSPREGVADGYRAAARAHVWLSTAADALYASIPARQPRREVSLHPCCRTESSATAGSPAAARPR